MKRKRIIVISVLACAAAITTAGIFYNSRTTDINILATTDIHGSTSRSMVSYVKNYKKEGKADLVVDSGDFWGSGTNEMLEWISGKKPLFDESGRVEFYGEDTDGDGFPDKNGDIDGDGVGPDMKYEKVREPWSGEAPILRDMKKMEVDSVTLGNHEFVESDINDINNIISMFDKAGISVLSANIYNSSDDKNFVKPYIIKEIEKENSSIKVAVLGLTLPEIAEPYELNKSTGEYEYSGNYNISSLEQYENKLYLNDLVEEATKWSKYIEKHEKPDIVVLTVHSGEEPKKPKHPGNRVKEIAHKVPGIDIIVAGHTHATIQEHNYKNNVTGDNVLVTQPSSNGRGISNINIKLKKENNNWKIIDISSKVDKLNIVDMSKFDYSKYTAEEAYNIGYRL